MANLPFQEGRIRIIMFSIVEGRNVTASSSLSQSWQQKSVLQRSPLVLKTMVMGGISHHKSTNGSNWIVPIGLDKD